ncbi:hypothetical protein McPS_15550 [Marichromatium sp. PS1]
MESCDKARALFNPESPMTIPRHGDHQSGIRQRGQGVIRVARPTKGSTGRRQREEERRLNDMAALARDVKARVCPASH